MNFNKPITSASEAKSFFYGLNKIGKLFHPNDDPSTIVNPENELIFNEAESQAIKLRITEIRQFLPDPCEFIIDEFF